MFRIMIAAACILAAAGGARAQEAKPVATLNTETIEATLTMDPALNAYPGLYDDLLAEGRSQLADARAEADKDSKDMPEMFEGGRRYTFVRNYSERSVIGRYVSVLRGDYMDEFAGHPNRSTDTILWDTTAKKRISIRPFFKETADGGATMRTLATAIRAALVADKKARDVPDVDKDPSIGNVKPNILSIGGIALAPSTEKGKASGLIAYFPPYAVGPYIEGDYVLFVPWTAFKDRLSAAGLALFGGARPADDAKKDEP